MNPAVAAILQPSLMRFTVAVASHTGPADVRERLRLAQADKLTADGAVALGAELDVLADLLTRR